MSFRLRFITGLINNIENRKTHALAGVVVCPATPFFCN